MGDVITGVFSGIVNSIPNGHISNFSASYLVRIDVFKYITFRAFIDSQNYITLFYSAELEPCVT